MKQHLDALARGEVSFDEFARRTATDWTRLAGKVYSAWRRNLPVGVSLDDIRQEMLLHAWLAVGEYDTSRGGMSLKSYVVYMACAKATRFVHEQRCAKRRDDHAPSRHPVTFTELLRIDDEPGKALDLLLEDSSTQDPSELLDARAKFARALTVADGVDLYALVALREAFGNIPQAAELLFDEVLLRLHERWGSPHAAMRQIEDSMRQLCA